MLRFLIELSGCQLLSRGRLGGLPCAGGGKRAMGNASRVGIIRRQLLSESVNWIIIMLEYINY